MVKGIWALLAIVFVLGANAYDYDGVEVIEVGDEELEVAARGIHERQVVLVEDPLIFGLDLLGWGIDLRAGKPEEALRVPVFYPWSYNDNRTYLYPLEPETTFTVPDEVFVRTVAELESTTKYFESTTSYIEFLELSLGLALAKNSTSGAPDTSNQNSSAFDLSSFAGSVDVSYISNTLKDGSHVYIYNSLESGLWQLVVGPFTKPAQRVQQAVDEAKASYDAGNQDAFAEFCNLYGTHYIESVIVGGILEMDSLTAQSSSNTSQNLAIAASFSFQKAFGIDAGSVELGVDYAEIEAEFQKEATNWFKALGGDPELANFFSGNSDPATTFVNWQQTLIRNPAVIRYRLRNISWLFGTYRTIVASSVAGYLAGNPTFD